MTTLYRPVLIESAEQAAALPIGTLARHATGPGMDHAHKVSPIGRDVWVAVGGNCTNAEMAGWTALVPIEAEEEWGLVLDDDGSMDIAESEAEVREWVRLGDEPRPPVHRYVTPWEEA